MPFRTERFVPTTAESRRYYGYQYGKKLKNRTGNKSVANCIFGGHSHGDRNPSASVDFVKGTWFCHTCNIGGGIFDFEKQLTNKSDAECWDAIYSILGRSNDNNRQAQSQAAPRSRPNGRAGQERKQKPKQPDVPQEPEPSIPVKLGPGDTLYPYVNMNGEPIHGTLRCTPKKFWQCRPDGNGGWVYGLGGIAPVLFDQPGLARCNVAGVTEGEKDKFTFDQSAAEFPNDGGRLTYCGTNCAMGAGKWREEYALSFQDKLTVFVFEDNDKAGRDHAQQECESISKYVDDVRLVRFTDYPEHGDLSDYRRDHSAAELYERMQATPKWEPQVDGEDVEEDGPEPEAETEPDTQTSAAPDDWPEPEELGNELPPVPAFDLELMPDVLRPMVEDVADRMQTPPDFPAIVSVATLAGLCGRRAVIQPKEHDYSWSIVPNLWGGIVAPPAMMKSPVIACITAPAHLVEAKWRIEYESDLADAEMHKVLTELKTQAWKQQYVAATKKGEKEDKLPIRPDDSIREPRQKRLLTTDATFESLQWIMANNLAGIFVLRDELTGWLAGLERQGREQERAFFLECWNGDTPHTIDRIGRGSIHVDHCCVSLFGGIQPARLRAYLADALRDGPTNDGLIQRFQLLVWPDTKPDWCYRDRLPSASALRAAEGMYQRIATMDVDNPLRLKFAPDAQALFVEWLTHLETDLRADDVSVYMQAHLGKYRKLMPALALLFSLADNALKAVELCHAQQAADWCDYLACHARRVYASRISPERLAAISLAKKLRKGWKRESGVFTVRDVYQNDWSGLGTPEEVRAAVRVVEEAGWVRLKNATPETGRPSEVYEVNPKIGCVHEDH
jgi:hypothetical protein